MEYYLFNGTIKREIIGDVIIDLSKVCFIHCAKIVETDVTYFMVGIDLNAGLSAKAAFSTAQEAMDAVIRLGVPREIISNCVFTIIDKKNLSSLTHLFDMEREH